MRRMKELYSIIYKIAYNSKRLRINSPLNTQIQLKLPESPTVLMIETEAPPHHLDSLLQERGPPASPGPCQVCSVTSVWHCSSNPIWPLLSTAADRGNIWKQRT